MAETLPTDISIFLRGLADHPLQDEIIDVDDATETGGWVNDEGGYEFENDEAYDVARDTIADARSLCKKYGIDYVKRITTYDEEMDA